MKKNWWNSNVARKKSEIFTATEIYLQVMTRQSQKRAAAAAKHEECELRRCMVHH